MRKKILMGVLFYLAGGLVAVLAVFVFSIVNFPEHLLSFFAATSILISWIFIVIVTFFILRVIQKNDEE